MRQLPAPGHGTWRRPCRTFRRRCRASCRRSSRRGCRCKSRHTSLCSTCEQYNNPKWRTTLVSWLRELTGKLLKMAGLVSPFSFFCTAAPQTAQAHTDTKSNYPPMLRNEGCTGSITYTLPRRMHPSVKADMSAPCAARRLAPAPVGIANVLFASSVCWQPAAL